MQVSSEISDAWHEPGAGQLLSFEVGGELCALAITEVQEIVEYHPITRVPAAPRFVLGVFNLRGNVVPVLDLASRLGLAPKPLGRRACLIVLQARDREESSRVALLTDAVNQVLEPAPSDFNPAPALGTRIAPELLSAMVQTSDGLVSLLDAERLLPLERAPPAALAGDGASEAEA